MKKYYPSAGPSVSSKEIKLVTEAVTKGWYDDRNLHTNQFIVEFSKLINRKYVLPTSNCTSAIHLSLLSLGIKEGDEVIVPDITWVASVSPIIYVGAKPIFIDINKDDWCLNIDSFKKAITKRTKAIIAIDLYGNIPDMDVVEEICKEKNIKLIEDAAEGLGSKYKKRPAGSFGDISVFSFNATKIAMSGQGGVLATNDKDLYEKAKLYSHHGMVKYTDKTTFWSVVVGYNYQWTNIQAALALAQIRRIDELVEKRRKIFKWYFEELSIYDGLSLNFENENVYSSYWVVSVVLDDKFNLKKEKLLKLMSKENIDCRPIFYPSSIMPAFKDYHSPKYELENTNSYHISAYGVSLPSYANLEEEDVKYICGVFLKIISKN
tara:strand:+ start:1915 stop:3048 length:1134 start_codon:yes stop_codon:yes gene_type:complete